MKNRKTTTLALRSRIPQREAAIRINIHGTTIIWSANMMQAMMNSGASGAS